MKKQTFKSKLKNFDAARELAQWLTALGFNVNLNHEDISFLIDAERDIEDETDFLACEKCLCLMPTDHKYCGICGEKL